MLKRLHFLGTLLIRRDFRPRLQLRFADLQAADRRANHSEIAERRPESMAPAHRAAVGRLPLMALAGASLLAALWAGLIRLGWQ